MIRSETMQSRLKKFFTAVIRGRRIIIPVFICLVIVSALMKGGIYINYDMRDYLPAGTPSTAALETLEAEFDGGIPNARVMVSDVTIAEALEYKARIAACDGVKGVIWLDDAVDIYEPLELCDAAAVETYYRDGTALFSVTMDKARAVDATTAVRAVIGAENAMCGDAVATAVATTSTENEITLITVGAVLFVTLMLILTTSSWFEPVVILLGLAAAIVINAGTNIIFGEISFVTNAAGMVLQLAVSLDYSVFLIHRYEECKLDAADHNEAMAAALCSASGSILSSGLTTVIGFLALVFMRFGIGPDLGLALAKGVAISLLTAFVFVPALTLGCDKLLEKTRHRPFLPSFRTFGKVTLRLMAPMVIICALVAVPAFLASSSNSYLYGASRIFGGNTQLGSDTERIEALFGKSDTYALLVPRGDMADEQALSAELNAIPEVTSVISYVDSVGAEVPQEYIDPDTLAKLVSERYSRFVIAMDTDYEGEATFRLVETVRQTAARYYPGEYLLAGEGVSAYDLMDTITSDTLKVNLIAIGAVFAVLLIMTRSVTLPVILVLCIESAIWINTGIPYFAGQQVFYIAYLIISSVQLGATVDYAILFTDRYREFRRACDKRTAVVETVSACTASIITSASVMAVVGYLLGRISTHGILSQLGIFVGRGALLSLATVLFVLPGLLYLFDGLFTRKSRKKSAAA